MQSLWSISYSFYLVNIILICRLWIISIYYYIIVTSCNVLIFKRYAKITKRIYPILEI